MNLNEIVRERTEQEPEQWEWEEPEQNVPEITQEQITKSIQDILFQRLSESEVELMKAENVQLKQTLADFTSNYNKFEELISNTIRKNNASVMQSLNEQNKLLEQRLNEQDKRLNMRLQRLEESNAVVSREVSMTVGSVRESLVKITREAGREISGSVNEATKNIDESINTMSKKVKKFWSFSSFQTYTFWSAMLTIIVLALKPTMEAWSLELPELFWKIAYPVALAPVTVFLVCTLISAIVEKVQEMRRNQGY